MNLTPLRFAGACALVTALSFTGKSVFADTGTELDTVRVTASRTGNLAETLPAGTVILEQQDIRRMPARNLADVLDSVGGLSSSRTYGINGSRASVDMFGFGANAGQNTLVLLNGRRLNDLDLSATDFAAIPLAAIERIEVLPGTGAVLHGSGASAGVINIVTRERYETGAGIEATLGDFSTRGADIWGAASSGDSGIVASAQALDSDGYRDNNAVRQRNAFANVRHRQNDVTGYITVLADDQELGLPGNRSVDPGTGTNELKDDPRGTNTPNDFADQQGIQWQPGLVFHFENMDLYVEGAQRQKKQQFFFEDFAAYQERQLDMYSINPRATGILTLAGMQHNWTIGADASVSKFQVEFADSPDDIDNPTGSARIRQEQQAAYLQTVTALTDRLSLLAGARHERLKVRARQEDVPFTGSGSDGTRENFNIAEAGINAEVLGGLTLFANTARTVRIANADEISPASGELLRPQTGDLHTGGMRWRSGSQYSILTLWYGRFSDEIIFDPTAGTFGENANLDDDTRRRGGSLTSRFDLDSNLSLTASYTLQDARYRDGPFRGNTITGVAERNGYLQLDWQATDNFSVVASQRYAGERRFGGDEENDFGRKIPSYSWTDLVLRAQEKNLYWQIGVYNLQDRLAYDSGFVGFAPDSYSALPLPGRHVMTSIGVDF